MSMAGALTHTLCYMSVPVAPKPPEGLWSEDVAARLGITRASWATLRNPHRARPKLKPPPADGVDITTTPGMARSWWYPATIDVYVAMRPGAGARTDLVSDLPAGRSGDSAE